MRISFTSASTHSIQKNQKILEEGSFALRELVACVASKIFLYPFFETTDDMLTACRLGLLGNIRNFYKIGKMYLHSHGFNVNEPGKSKFLEASDSVLFWLGTAMDIQCLIHELGHFFAFKASYKDLPVGINLRGGGSGSTIPYFVLPSMFYPLTILGQLLGRNGTDILITAGGPILDFLNTSFCLILSRQIENKYPTIASRLKWCSYLEFASLAHYAALAITMPPSSWDGYIQSHDFAKLRYYGLNPLIPTIACIVAPILINLGMNSLAQHLKKK